MEIILLTGRRPVARILGKPALLFTVVGAFLASSAALVYGGYLLGRGGLEVAADSYFSSGQAATDASSQQIVSDVRLQVSTEIDALTTRLGQLQGHIARVDALGQKLVSMADLDEGEFDFSAAPAVGGPEAQDAYAALRVPELDQAIEALEAQVADRERQLDVLEQFILTRNLEDEVSPSGRPILSGWQSSNYGWRTSPFGGGRQFHKGIDFAGKLGSDVVAVAGGVVSYVGKQPGYGLMVEISHANGYATRYAHTMESLVEAGQAVKKGQLVAKMGSSGRSTGPHVHFEVLHNGRHINPSEYVARR
jgi:uncharacterized small protein (DUF1192 family)